ncbi:class I SAM-dependent methyltransferase [Aureimonas mangrovi]|uniref:class I SAM-dependent methyltransferase n=1 Tax=Aureimonas mangrovi TaxID=2758041 RepID=UPI001FE35EA6|nr:methyltransferase [Aureimonas mangrovi]
MTLSASSAPAVRQAVYGEPDPGLVDVDASAAQLSPFREGSLDIAGLPDESLETIVVAAPPGAAERRFVLAHALRALRPSGRLTALAAKDKGGARIAGELEAFGCAVSERFKARQRICECERPLELAAGLDPAIAQGAPRFDEALGLWSQPGVFSFDRIDPGSALLMSHLPTLKGRGADLGAGLGILSRAILASEAVTSLTLVEIDRRAAEAARRNVVDPRATILWADARRSALSGLDFVVTNPPFHAEGAEDKSLGQEFVRAAAAMLARGGTLHLVANRHLPYEAVLRAAFRSVETVAEGGGYKIFEARKG